MGIERMIRVEDLDRWMEASMYYSPSSNMSLPPWWAHVGH